MECFLGPIFVFIFGTFIGSFLNVVILRYNSGESFLKGRSKCFSCGHEIGWQEMIPVLSYFLLRGQCSNCKSKISIQYPIVEFLAGALFTIIYLKFFNQWLLVVDYWVLFSLLLVIAFYDFRHQIIPNGIVYLFNLFALINIIKKDNFLNLFWTGVALFVFFGLLWLITRGRGMGLGDAKLSLGLGWLLGADKAIIALLISFWVGSIIGIILMIKNRKRYSMKSKIAFGPFLILGFLVSFFYGSYLTNFLDFQILWETISKNSTLF